MTDSGVFLHAAERERRIDANRHLCRRAARRFVRHGLERSDLEQVAAVGLIKAADRYVPEMKTPFEAFAWTLVLGELLHFVRDHERPVRVPRELMRIERAATRAADRLRVSLGREPADFEIAEELCISLATVREARFARGARTISLDPGDGTLERQGARARIELEPADRLAVRIALDRLAPLARSVVLGLHVVGYRRGELAARLGLSARHVARINVRALAELARSMSSAA